MGACSSAVDGFVVWCCNMEIFAKLRAGDHIITGLVHPFLMCWDAAHATVPQCL